MRTSGSVSNIDICSHDLIRLIGGIVADNTPKIHVTVNKKWLDRFQQPGSEFVAVTAEDFARLNTGEQVLSLESGQTVSVPVARPSRATIEE